MRQVPLFRLARTLRNVAHEKGGAISADGKTYIDFSSNDYLGLSKHPALIERSRDWAGRYGAGSGASRLVTGNLEPFARIETKVAALKGTQAALVMALRAVRLARLPAGG